jgi:deoxyribonuclease IV
VFISTFPRFGSEQLFFLSVITRRLGARLVRVGLHVSISGTIDQAVDRARELGCDTFQIFTRNPRGWKYKKLKGEEVEEFRRKLESDELTPVVAHMPYLPNLSSPKQMIYNRSVKSLSAELDRCGMLRLQYLVTHLGSHMGEGQEVGLERITGAINSAVAENPNDVMLLLENTAGTKNSMGSSFEDLRRILQRVDDRQRVGVCFDTAHAYAAGYDLHSPRGVEETLARFNQVLGFDLLRVIHLNDSKGGLGSGRDRHEHIGMGYIGEKGFKAFLKHNAIQNLPLIMETPIDDRRDELGNLRKVRELSA